MIKITNKISATLQLVARLESGETKTYFIPPRVRGLVIEEITLDQVISSAMPLHITGVRSRLSQKRESFRSANTAALEQGNE